MQRNSYCSLKAPSHFTSHVEFYSFAPWNIASVSGPKSRHGWQTMPPGSLDVPRNRPWQGNQRVPHEERKQNVRYQNCNKQTSKF